MKSSIVCLEKMYLFLGKSRTGSIVSRTQEVFTLKGRMETITTEAMLAVINQTWERLAPVLEQLEPVLDAGPDAGGWTPRQVLSHIVGAWQRVPVHSAFFVAGRPEVPIVFGDSYWIPEWEHAPMETFRFAMQTAYEGNKAFIRQLTSSDLTRTCGTRFGVMTLGEFLMTCYVFHIGDLHISQLEGFLIHSLPGPSKAQAVGALAPFFLSLL